MKIVGIVAEYNPFHNGHKMHILETKKAIGGDVGIVCCMSGDFVQRGEPAIFSKHARAKAAIAGGADLILELPLPWSLSSAESFAAGAVGILGEIGCVDYLSFGSECGEVNPLYTVASALLNPSISEEIKEELKTGVSYARARQTVLTRNIGELAAVLESPNNILATEYIKSLIINDYEIKPITFLRFGAGHDDDSDDEQFRSASYIRADILSGASVSDFIPAAVLEIINSEIKNGRGPISTEKMELMLLSLLRMKNRDVFDNVPDATEGLNNRLYMHAKTAESWDALTNKTKSKRYAMSRIRRMAMCASLGIKSEDKEGIPPYTRVLAFNEKGREILRRIDSSSDFPVITKPATVRRLNDRIQKIFSLSAVGSDLYSLTFKNIKDRRGGEDYKKGPIII